MIVRLGWLRTSRLPVYLVMIALWTAWDVRSSNGTHRKVLYGSMMEVALMAAIVPRIRYTRTSRFYADCPISVSLDGILYAGCDECAISGRGCHNISDTPNGALKYYYGDDYEV